METKLTENPLISNWLAEKRSKATRETYPYKIRTFLDYFGITPEELLKLTPKETRTLALRFQNEQPDMPNNTVLSHLTAVGSFLDFHDKPIKWKRSRVKPRPDISSHVYSNGDLSRMFQVGDVRDKAMLSLATSLGWEISGFVNLKRKTIQDLINRAKENNEHFIYFKNIRHKTGALRLGVLNPLAIEWLDKWLKISSDNTKQKPEKVNPVSNIFLLTDRGIQNRLKILAIRADIKTTGRVRFHNIRKWVMSGLSRCGFNEWQTKFVLGKAIPLADSTYLQTLEFEVKDRYPKAYDEYLNLENETSKDLKKKTLEIESENKRLNDRVKQLESKSTDLEEIQRQMNFLKNQIADLVKTGNKDKRLS